MSSRALSIAAAAALALAVGARAEGPASDPGLLLPAEKGRAGVLVLRDGRTFAGRILEVGAERLQLKLPDRSVLELPLPIVRGVVANRVPYGALGAPSAVRVVLADGVVLGAARVERQGERLVLVSGELRREVPAADVRAVFEVREGRRPISLAQRELGAPSAFMPEGGEVLLANRLTQASATLGLLGRGVLEVGSTVPAQLARPYGSNLQASLRGGVALLPWLRAAAGVHADLSRAGRLVAASATLTAGSSAAHVGLHAGPMPRGANLLAANAGETGVALSGTYSLSGRWDLLAEGWLSRRDGASSGLALGAVRLRAGRVGLEAGAGRSFPDGDLFPWLAAAVDVTAW